MERERARRRRAWARHRTERAWRNFILNVEELAREPRIVAHSEAPPNVGDNPEKVPLAYEPPGSLPPLLN